MTTLTTAQTASQLSALSVNERMWFWLCPGAETVLLMQPFTDANALKTLQKRSLGVTRPKTSPQYVGVAAIGEDGRMRLSGKKMARNALEALAAWVQENTSAHKGLAALNNTMILPVGPDGKVSGTIEDASLWAETKPAPAAGSFAAAAQQLEAASRHPQGAWLWMAAQGPDGNPVMIVIPCEEDPRGRKLARKVKAMVLRGARGETVRGVVRRAKGAPAFITRDSMAASQAIREALVNNDDVAMRALAGSWMFKMMAERSLPVESHQPMTTLTNVDLSAQSKILSALDENTKAYFWTHIAEDGQTHLELAMDRDALTQKVETISGNLGDGLITTGRLRMHAKGFLLFQSRTKAPNFIASLARWTALWATEWPALSRLKGSRMIARDRNGDVIDRQRADAAWTALVA